MSRDVFRARIELTIIPYLSTTIKNGTEIYEALKLVFDGYGKVILGIGEIIHIYI